tara:strand:- start:6623 stop:6844 length:222 start_codon:yes stop_codon:yes gene_type:complete
MQQKYAKIYNMKIAGESAAINDLIGFVDKDYKLLRQRNLKAYHKANKEKRRAYDKQRYQDKKTRELKKILKKC